MGFYAPAQIVRDTSQHGVEVHRVDVNFSNWDNALERDRLHLGLRQIDVFRESWAEAIVAARSFTSVEAVARQAKLPARATFAWHSQIKGFSLKGW